MSQDSTKTFFLGIGAAKSGTSWVYDFLANHPEVQAGPVKEMHVLNSNVNCGIFTAIRELPWQRFAGRKWLIENLWKAYYRANWDRYFLTYEKILASDFRATGEISTSYMTVSAETLRTVQRHFRQRNIRVVGLLVLRDPVDRIVSEMRFRKRLSKENRYAKNIEDSLDDLAAKVISNSGDSSYQTALSTIQQVFPHEDRFVCLYEELFQQSNVDSLCDRIGISRIPGQFSKKVNATPSNEVVPEEVISDLRCSLDNAYVCSESYFGEARLREYWRYH